MKKISEFLKAATKATETYSSYKYCLEAVEVPKNQYDDKPNAIIKPKERGETEKLESFKVLKDRAKLASEIDKPLFKYFLDGSRRTYKVADIAINKRIYPVIAGQIGVACCERKYKDSFKKLAFDHQLVLALPSCSNWRDDKHELFFNEKIQELNKIDVLNKFNIKFHKILIYKDEALKEGESYENKGIAKIQDEMIETEKSLVMNLVQEKKLTELSYLLKDGSLEYTKTGAANSKKLSDLKKNYQCVVGASKSFDPELCEDNNKKSIAQFIADLPLYARTPAFKYSVPRIPDIYFSVWYLRIRAQKHSASPFDGVLKIEKILVTDKENEIGLDSDEIDRISAHIINERNPTCYGTDKRWANHLYPIYLTESFIKSQYLSNSLFLNLF
jgi:hypothetical protein